MIVGITPSSHAFASLRGERVVNTKLRWQVSNWNKNAITFYKRGASIDDVEMNCDLKV